MDDIDKSYFFLHLNYPDSTRKSVRRLLKIWLFVFNIRSYIYSKYKSLSQQKV